MTNAKNTSGTRASVTTTKSKTKVIGPAPAKLAKSASRTPAKAVTKAVPKPSTAAAQTAAKAKHKLVRDSFTIPKSEYAILEGLKVRAANLTRPVKKSELLRAGVAVLHGMADKAFLAALNGVPSLKTGRPKGSETTPTSGKTTK